MHEIPDHCWHFKSRPGLTWRAQLEALAASQLRVTTGPPRMRGARRAAQRSSRVHAQYLPEQR